MLALHPELVFARLVAFIGAVLEIGDHHHAHRRGGRDGGREHEPQQNKRNHLHLGMEPSTPSTYQLIALSSSCVRVVPAATLIVPVLSFRGPAKGASLPSMMACFLSSNSL